LADEKAAGRFTSSQKAFRRKKQKSASAVIRSVPSLACISIYAEALHSVQPKLKEYKIAF
jgi:hypothetical protein